MSATIGQTSTTLSPYDPPTSALPPLPISKTRKSLPSSSANASGISPRIPSAPQTPSKLRTPSKPAIPVPKSQSHASSTPVVPTLKNLALSRASVAGPPGEKSLRKSVSIASFPQPPRQSRIGRPSLPGSITTNLPSPSSLKRTDSEGNTPTTPASASTSTSAKPKRLKKTSSSAALNTAYTNGPSLLNGSGDSVAISAASQTSLPGLFNSNGSRSSSAQGSHSTGTNFEDIETIPRSDRKDGDERSSRRSTLKEGKGNVVVSVRVRPNDAADATSDCEWMVDGRRSLIAYKGKEGGDYYYDNVFSPHDNNAKLYEVAAKRLVRRVMEGYHGTVFAYGMTGTGKTFSMQGIGTQPGIIPQAVTDIFSYIRETPHREFLLRASYLEIYNEEIRDLLNVTPAGGQAEKIQLREDRKRGVYATPVKEEIVQSPMQLLRVISRGDRARHTGTTQYNVHSSRSHAIVKIVVESRERVASEGAADDKRNALGHGGVRVSSLSMIDLAGSERAADSKERRTEGAHINKSLLTLGTVIARLSGDKDKNGNPTDKDGKHLPYRDSKLTRLLQPALSGTSLISILCTIQIGSTGSVATASSHTLETINTLKFAARAKNNIVSHAKKAEEAHANSTDPGSIALLDHYRKEIATLRSQLDTSVQLQTKAEKVIAKAKEDQMEKETEDRHKDQMLEMQLARTALKERIEHLNRLILCSQSQGVNLDRSISALSLHPVLSNAHSSITGTRSLRSSTSGSTIQRTQSVASQNTITSHFAALRSQQSMTDMSPSIGPDVAEEDDFEEGVATLQAQNNALQRDLADKTRYISTLEKRLLHARRSSGPRSSVGVSLHALQDRDAEIADLRSQVDDQNRTIASLRASVASFSQHENESITTTPVSPSVRNHHASDSFGSSSAATSNSTSFSPIELPKKNSSFGASNVSLPLPHSSQLTPLPAPPKELPPLPTTKRLSNESPMPSTSRATHDRVGGLRESAASSAPQRRSIDEMSRMLDEMIQEKVQKGELVDDGRGKGGIKVAGGNRRHGSADGNLPTMASVKAPNGVKNGPTNGNGPARKKSADAAAPSVGTLMAGLRSRTDSLDRERDGGKMGVKDRERHVGLGLEIEG